jgi:hypothetical protein
LQSYDISAQSGKSSINNMCKVLNGKKVKSILFTCTDISNGALEGNGNRYNTIDDQYLGSMVLQILQYFYKQ